MKRLSTLLIALMFMGSTVWAQQTTDEWLAFKWFDFTGGLNDGYSSISIAPNEAQSLQNVVFTLAGAVKKRKGYTKLHSSAPGDGISGIGFYKQANGTRYLLALTSDSVKDKIWKMDYDSSGPDGTWDEITGSISSNWTDDTIADFTFGQNKVIIEDGLSSSAPFLWDGSGNAADLGGSPPSATMVEYHKNHLFMAGDSSNPSRLTFSQFCTNATAPSCIENYTATDIIDVETNDGQIIRSIKSALDALYIFKDRSIWRLSGFERDTFVLEQMVSGYGTLSNRSVEIINNQFIFVTAECDVAVYDGGIRVQIISSKIEGTIDNLNYDRCDNAIATVFDDGSGDEDYYLSVASGGSSQNDTILLYDTFHKAWTKFSGMAANDLTTYEISTLERNIAFGDYGGFVYRYPNGNNDAGSAINAFWISGDYKVQDLPYQVAFKQAQVIVDQSGSYSIDFTQTIDFTNFKTDSISLAGSGALWDSAIWDTDIYADTSTAMKIIDTNRIGDFYRWKISNVNADEPFTVRGIRLWMQSTKRLGSI